MLEWGLERTAVRIFTALSFDAQVQVVHAVCLGCTSLCARKASARQPLTPGFSSAPGEHNDGVCETTASEAVLLPERSLPILPLNFLIS